MKSFVIVFLFLVTEGIVNADTDCGVVPMTQWAGEASLHKEALTNPVYMVIIQHTATPEGSSDEDCERLLKAIRKYHRETLAFDDIGESFLVCGNGKVFEGAGWSLVGAHTKGYNSKSIGISFIGDYSSRLPTSEALTAAQNLIACGVSNSHLSDDYKLVGHRQVDDTISPGDALQKTIETWPHWTNTPQTI